MRAQRRSRRRKKRGKSRRQPGPSAQGKISYFCSSSSSSMSFARYRAVKRLMRVYSAVGSPARLKYVSAIASRYLSEIL